MRSYSNFLILLISLFTLCCMSLPNMALASKTENATALIFELLDHVKNIQQMSDNEDKKRAEFFHLINTFFDMDIIAKASTGPYWRTATSDEKERYTELITELIADVTAFQMGNITNFTFDFKSALQKGEKMVMVSGDLLIPEQSVNKIAISWRVSFFDEKSAKIIDVEFENISMLVTQKQENIAIIRKNGGVFSELIKALEDNLKK